jgi:hypothetical protein
LTITFFKTSYDGSYVVDLQFVRQITEDECDVFILEICRTVVGTKCHRPLKQEFGHVIPKGKYETFGYRYISFHGRMVKQRMSLVASSVAIQNHVNS